MVRAIVQRTITIVFQLPISFSWLPTQTTLKRLHWHLQGQIQILLLKVVQAILFLNRVQYIRTTGIIGRACAIRIYYRKWVGTSVDSTDPSHFEFQLWCSWMLASWSYSFPNVASESIKDRKIAYIFGLRSMLLLWSNSRRVIGNFGKLHDLAATRPILVVVAASDTERCREYRPGLVIFNRTVDFSIFLA